MKNFKLTNISVLEELNTEKLKEVKGGLNDGGISSGTDLGLSDSGSKKYDIDSTSNDSQKND